ncbi:hypothetical protein [Mucilaginibacter sp. 44-25]|uniref:hypothetical protein n=1 Tax=Mucilaginibacter sp. 44-25 TaxID=1895794 RepID=UPI000A7200D5|nr:hypothetical protein [Mucilaginibacter sp. 44-25]
MPQLKKIANSNKYTNVIVTDNVRSYANDPFFAKKLEDAKKTLSNLTWPDTSKK